MNPFTGFGSRSRLAYALEDIVPRLGEVSWCGTSEALPFKTRTELGGAQLGLNSVFGPGKGIDSTSERWATQSLEILRQGPKPWTFVPDKGFLKWHDPLGVLLAKLMDDRISTAESPQTLLLMKLAHRQPGDTVALTWHPSATSEPIPVSLSALAVMAFAAQLPDAVDQHASFYGYFRAQMFYATPDWWQPDATGLLLGTLRNRSIKAGETTKRLAVFKALMEEGLPVDSDGVDDLAQAHRRVQSFNGLDFIALEQDMGALHRDLVKSRLDHISAPSSSNVRPPRL